MAHSLWGAPNWLYGELDAAIISYIEFPSYLAHGWDAAYPPDQPSAWVTATPRC
ncbi:hypothetical protein [Comamonas sp. JC664]|uniref:hypothetical protein n=1 Tax=Comamonas sp. JC664 TaxID=2801917 RepID=UPI0036069AB0